MTHCQVKLKIVIICFVMFLFHPPTLIFPTRESFSLKQQDQSLEKSLLEGNIQVNEKKKGTSSLTLAEDDIPVSFGFGDKHSPATVVDTNGNLFTVYTYSNSTHYFLDIMKSNDSENWTRLMYIYSSNELNNPDIAIDLFNNNIYVVYEEEEVGNSSSCDIYIFRYYQWDIVGVDTDINDQRNPAIAIEATYGSNNHIYVAYEQVVNHDNRKMVVRKSTTQGDSWIEWHSRGFADQNVHTQMDIAIDFSGQVFLTYAYGDNYSALQRVVVEYGPKDSASVSFEEGGFVYYTPDNTLNFPVIAVSRSTAITTKIVIAFEYIWGPPWYDPDIMVVSSSDGGATWSDSYVALTNAREQRPNVVPDGMDLNSSLEESGNFYLVYTQSIQDVSDSFIILTASYSSLTNWRKMYTYQGTKNIWNMTKRTYGTTTYSNNSTNLVITYAATSCYGCTDTQIYSTRIFSSTSSSFTITSPNSTTKWTAGTIETITWTYTGSIDFINIFLYKNDTPLGWIAQGAPNLGYYDWGIPDFLDPGTDYWMDIEDSNNTIVYAISSDFEIIVDNPRIYFTNPTPVSAWRAGATYVVTWNCKNPLGVVTLELLKDGEVVDELSDDADGESHFKWEIPDDIAEGEDYQLKISLNSNSNVFGISEEFKIIAPFFEKEKSTEIDDVQFFPTLGFNYIIGFFGIITTTISIKRKRG